MSSATTYQDIHALKKLFAEAGETGIMASNALADILNATAPNAKAWPESTRKEWQEGCEHIFEGVKATDKLAPEQVRLLQAMLYTGIDTPMLREKYNQLFKALFPRCTNTAGILDAIGIDTVSDLAVAAGRLKVFAAIKEDATCWDAAFGLGKVLGLDEAACEVKVSQERERLVPLQDFLDRSVIILKGSAMEALIEKKSVNYADSQELHNAAREGLVTRLEITSQQSTLPTNSAGLRLPHGKPAPRPLKRMQPPPWPAAGTTAAPWSKSKGASKRRQLSRQTTSTAKTSRTS